jgi:hypothetical protein
MSTGSLWGGVVGRGGGSRGLVVRVLGLTVALFGLMLCVASAVRASGDANGASCPNEGLAGFESYLPDCRGYELLSPSYEEGQPLMFRGVSEELGDGPPHLIFTSLGDAAGVSNETDAAFEPAMLEVGRDGGSGWGASSLAPAPGGEVGDSADQLYDASMNFGSTLWTVRAALQSPLSIDFYTRSSAGSFVPVGPVFSKEAIEKFPTAPQGDLEVTVGGNNNFKYMGASNNLGHVLFVLKHEEPGSQVSADLLWPGDMTEAYSQSLYEYAGVGNTVPALVGVEGGRGSTALISRCGTDLGSTSYELPHFGSVFNAIADEGGVVFFTAVHSGECESRNPGVKQPAASELYARVDGEKSVAVSEPVLPVGAECTEDHECFGAAPREAIFQGASRDGSKVFFLTEQSLVNGDEDETMDLYEAELEGTGESTKVGRLVQVSHDPVVSKAAEVQGVARISMDGSHVYFVAKGILATNANGEGQRAVEGADNLYLFEQDARYPAGRTVFVATLSPADDQDWSHEDSRQTETNECGSVGGCEDGRYLVFRSSAHLTSSDTSETSSGEDLLQIFEYDAVTGEIARVSSGETSVAYPEGYNQDGNISNVFDAPSFRAPGYFSIDSPTAALSGLSVSGDGSRVVFTSRDALTPGSGPECLKAYEYRSTGRINDGNVYLISDGHDLAGGGPEFCGTGEGVVMDPSGADIFFQSGDPLVPGAGGGIVDYYDAREDGGSTIGSGSGCSGEACRPESTPPSSPVAGSVSQNGEAGMAGPVGVTPVVVKVKAKVLTRAQKLAGALKVCRKKEPEGRNRQRRAVCEARARKRYGGNSGARVRGVSDDRRGK